MKKIDGVEPFVKWAGGKRGLLHAIMDLMPDDISECVYIEPFLGGGAVFLHMQPHEAIVNDINEDLVNAYGVIRDSPEELIEALRGHRNIEEYYYHVRGLDRSPAALKTTATDKASRFLFLNKTCYNGLYRVNAQGRFNAPFGRYENPDIVNEKTIRAVSVYLNDNNIHIYRGSYADVLPNRHGKYFVYMDPPYVPLPGKTSFTAYTPGGWKDEDHEQLRDACMKLDKDGIRFLLSNSSCPRVREMYKDFDMTTVMAHRRINSDSSGRGKTEELLIKNY